MPIDRHSRDNSSTKITCDPASRRAPFLMPRGRIRGPPAGQSRPYLLLCEAAGSLVSLADTFCEPGQHSRSIQRALARVEPDEGSAPRFRAVECVKGTKPFAYRIGRRLPRSCVDGSIALPFSVRVRRAQGVTAASPMFATQRKYSGNNPTAPRASVRRFSCREPRGIQDRETTMIKLGRVSKQTRGPAIPGFVEDLIDNLPGNQVKVR